MAAPLLQQWRRLAVFGALLAAHLGAAVAQSTPAVPTAPTTPAPTATPVTPSNPPPTPATPAPTTTPAAPSKAPPTPATPAPTATPVAPAKAPPAPATPAPTATPVAPAKAPPAPATPAPTATPVAPAKAPPVTPPPATPPPATPPPATPPAVLPPATLPPASTPAEAPAVLPPATPPPVAEAPAVLPPAEAPSKGKNRHKRRKKQHGKKEAPAEAPQPLSPPAPVAPEPAEEDVSGPAPSAFDLNASSRQSTPVYVAAIDLSSSEEFLELVKSSLLAALEALSPGSLFGLLTFSSKIGLYDVQGPIPIVKNVFIPLDSDGALHVDLEDVMPLCSFLAPIDSCKDRIAEALETIKPMSSWEVAANTSEGQDHVLHHTRGFGVALDVLVNYLSSGYGNAFKLARIFAFLSGPPNYGAGRLETTSFEGHNAGKAGDADNILLQEQTSFYKNLATSAVQAGVCVDLFAITNEFTDLTSLKVLSVESGGSLFLYSSTDESTLPQDIYKMLSRPYAFGCVMRLRTSSQFKIANSYGHFFLDPQYMHVQHINCCDSFATYSYDFEFEKDSRFSRKTSLPILQIAFKYTVLVHHADTSDIPKSDSRSRYSLQRRLRVRTIQYNATANIWDLYDFVDPDVVLMILVHQVILASLSDILEARLLLQDWLVTAIAQYNKAYKNVTSGGGTGIYDVDVNFSHCSQLQPLSRFVFAILLSPLLQVNSNGIHPDYRTYLQCLFSALEPASLRQAVWPTLISYSSPDVEAEVHRSLSRTVFTSESSIFLLDAYIDLLVYYSPTVGATIPFPPPRDCLLRSTIDRLKQERNITPKLVLIHGAHDDTTAFEKYLIEDQILDASHLASSTGFSSFLEEVRSKVAVAEYGI